MKRIEFQVVVFLPFLTFFFFFFFLQSPPQVCSSPRIRVSTNGQRWDFNGRCSWQNPGNWARFGSVRFGGNSGCSGRNGGENCWDMTVVVAACSRVRGSDSSVHLEEESLIQKKEKKKKVKKRKWLEFIQVTWCFSLRAEVHQVRRHRVQYGVMVQRVVMVHRVCAARYRDGAGPRRRSQAVQAR